MSGFGGVVGDGVVEMCRSENVELLGKMSYPVVVTLRWSPYRRLILRAATQLTLTVDDDNWLGMPLARPV